MGVSFDKIDGVIWYDGKLVPWADANVHVLTHGLHYASVFEGRARLWRDGLQGHRHSERLKNSARILDSRFRGRVAEMTPPSNCAGKNNCPTPISARSPGAARK